MPIDDPGWGGYTPEPEQQPAPPPKQSPLKRPLGDYKETLASLKSHRGALGKLNEKQMIAVGAAVVALILVAGLIRSNASDDEGSSAKGGAAAAGQASGSLEDFVQKVDEVCLKYREQVQQAAGNPDSSVLGGVHGQMIAEVRALGSPPESDPSFQEMLTAYDQSVRFLKAGDPRSAAQYGQQASAAAQQFGAVSCS
jgi:hypothetical protein